MFQTLFTRSLQSRTLYGQYTRNATEPFQRGLLQRPFINRPIFPTYKLYPVRSLSTNNFSTDYNELQRKIDKMTETSKNLQNTIDIMKKTQATINKGTDATNDSQQTTPTQSTTQQYCNTNKWSEEAIWFASTLFVTGVILLFITFIFTFPILGSCILLFMIVGFVLA